MNAVPSHLALAAQLAVTAALARVFPVQRAELLRQIIAHAQSSLAIELGGMTPSTPIEIADYFAKVETAAKAARARISASRQAVKQVAITHSASGGAL